MSKNHSTQKGFTLTEMMVVLVLVGLVGTLTSQFFIDTYKYTFISEQKNEINTDIRTFTGQMSRFARQANEAYIYPSFDADDRDTPGDRRGEAQSGDLLVLIYKGKPENLAVNIQLPVERIIGYYRSPANPSDPHSEGPVRMFTVEVPHDNRFDPVETLFPDASTSTDHPTVVELSEGLADGRLFYMFRQQPELCVMVNGKIIHGNQAKKVTDTYNFSISPRG